METVPANIPARGLNVTTLLLTLMATSVVSGGVAATSSADHASEVPGATDLIDEREIWFWVDLDLLTTLLCVYFVCDDGNVWTSTSATVEARMQAHIDDYEANGIDPSLTVEEKAAMLADAEATQAHITANSGYVDATLESNYLDTLSDVINDLQS